MKYQPQLNNTFIILFEILAAIIAYFILMNYHTNVEKFLITSLLFFFIFVNLYIGFFLQKKDATLLKLQKKIADENKINNTIFNLQKAIIVVRDDLYMSQANDAFFQTFDFKDIKDFSKKHTCICELFIEKKHVPHILPIMDKLSWTEYILKHNDKVHEAYMIDKYGKERIYSIDLKENVFNEQSMIVFTEITEIKNQIDTFQKLFYNSVDGLLMLKDNHFLDVNPTLLKMVECKDKEEFLKLNPQSLLPIKQPNGDLSSKVHSSMREECLKTGHSNRQRLQKKLSGKTFWCDIAMTRIKINHEDVIYVRWRDIHEYKQLQFSLEDQVSQQSQALISGSRLAAIGEMMENITHQWKQPLSIILNLINLLRMDLPKNKELLIISDQAQYLNNTISDFKNFSSRSEKEKLFFNLHKSIEHSLKIFNFQAELNHIKVIQNIPKEITIKGDIGKFNQAILVILSNAKDAFLESNIKKKIITINVSENTEHIYINIADNAGGIPLNIIEKIFDPYFTTKFKDKGTGIGLSMTYNIIKNIHGSISVSNDNNGAVFRITLPKNTNEKR